MNPQSVVRRPRLLPFAIVLAGLLAASSPALFAADAGGAPGSAAEASAASAVHKGRRSPFQPTTRPAAEQRQLRYTKGVDRLQVRRTGSGTSAMVRFTYRVVDPDLARVLMDKRDSPQLIAPRAGVALQVPVMDQIGPLRQSMNPVAGQEYWMVFANKGELVKKGDRVSVVIGKFRADNLVVQ